ITASTTLRKPGKVSIYPNPAKDRLSIYSGFQFNKVEIFSLNGSKVFQHENPATQSSMLNLHLDSGMYVLRISSEQYFASSKLLINL
ncbi:MAG TPA: T9SS type A sorting domain-containing protein, partial [Prolixibacteraceae bacterium]